ncbi:hypothetical protein [Nocardia australiensis]|uniref:hypothetical protein n=1 Tax=Nocardia australiensis TaxID=2887191 RepID=UPI001D13C93D|nr:hypothetical protein [Nocardia australiensis]
MYSRLIDPITGDALKALSSQRIPVGIVSDIAFDVRPVFAARGWGRWVGTYALSFEVGAITPDSRIFRSASEGLGMPATATRMIGYGAEAEGGATALGCGFALVDLLPTAYRAPTDRHGQSSCMESAADRCIAIGRPEAASSPTMKSALEHGNSRIHV